MSDAHPLRLRLTSPEDTARRAAAVARHARPGDVFLLSGPIGAGKTAFARAFIQARLAEAGAPVEDVPSPTFTLVQTYDAGGSEIWHADLYRLTHPDEVEELGLIDAFDTAICLVEWPDRLGELTPERSVRMTFRADDDDPDLRHLAIDALPDHLSGALSEAADG